LVVHVDHAKPHVAKRVKQFLDDHNLRIAPHPFYSPDLAPSDFFLFGYVERPLQGLEFATAEGLLGSVVKILSGIRGEPLMATFH
jgi:histone-lysine N-methyltransferase SETMAR